MRKQVDLIGRLGASLALGVSPESVRLWAQSGRLRSVVTRDGRVLYEWASVLELAEKRRESARNTEVST